MAFRLSGRHLRKEVRLMDQETVIALCTVFTVMIGIIELTRK